METDDGYLLSVQRIPGGRRGGGGGMRKQPVLLQHGVLVVRTLSRINQLIDNFFFLYASIAVIIVNHYGE